MIDKPFFSIDTINEFNSLKIGINKQDTKYIQNNQQYDGIPDVSFYTIIFINDIKQIWTRGDFYSDTNSKKIIEEKSGLSNREEMQQLIHDTVVMAHQELKA